MELIVGSRGTTWICGTNGPAKHLKMPPNAQRDRGMNPEIGRASEERT
jgi:hypothetical protein